MTLNNVRGTIIGAPGELDSIIGLMNTFTANRGLRTKAASSMLDAITAGFRNVVYGSYRNDPSSDVVDARIGTVGVGVFESWARTDKLL